jgi:hypothetical protein
MATVPVLDPIESRSVGQDVETLQFQRFERVRARQRARRDRQILVVMLIFVLSSIALLALAKRPTISGAASTPSATPTTPAAITMPVTVQAAASRPAAPEPVRVDEVKRDGTSTTPPPAERAPAPRRRMPFSGRSGESASVPSRPEPRDADVGDGTAAIDWLLKTSRPGRP